MSTTIQYISTAFIKNTFNKNDIQVQLKAFGDSTCTIRANGKEYTSTMEEVTTTDLYLLRNHKKELLFNKCMRKAFDELEPTLL